MASAHLWSRSDRYERWRWHAYHGRDSWSTTTAAGQSTTTSAPTTTQPARQDPTTTASTTTPTTQPTVTVPPAPIPLPPGPSSAGPPAGGYFSTLPPGSPFPSDAECAARVHHSTWEPRPENNTANHTAPTNPGALANFSQWNGTWNTTYKPRID